MDFKRKDGESERAYYSRVAQELKYGLRKGFEHLREYQLGHASVKELEQNLTSVAPVVPVVAPKAAPEASE